MQIYLNLNLIVECAFMKYNNDNDKYELWRRYDVKENNKGQFIKKKTYNDEPN